MVMKVNLTLWNCAMVRIQPGVRAIKIIVAYHEDDILRPERIV